MVIGNVAGAVMLVVAGAISLGLVQLFPRLKGRPAVIAAVIIMGVLDLVFRVVVLRSAMARESGGESSGDLDDFWLTSPRGGSFYLLPAWVISIVGTIVLFILL